MTVPFQPTSQTRLSSYRERSNYGLYSFHYSEIPGEYSNQQIDFHLEHCRNRGYVKGDLSGDKIMAMVSLTPEGMKYLQNKE